jgi:anthraniloyl-CoA monooxygenase
MRIVSIGGGPAGLYFGILMKKANPAHEIVVLERNRPHDTFGFGVVFSDATLENLERADPVSHRQILESFAHWDDIDVHVRGQVLTSTGHGFSGLSRKTLLQILTGRAESLGVELRFNAEVADLAAEPMKSADLILGADGVNSFVRAKLADHFRPRIEHGRNRFVWLGTTYPFQAFTFYFKENEHGLFRVHAYRYEPGCSTFIVECTDETFRRAKLVETDEDATIAYCERLFAEELMGHRLLKNRSLWRSFPTIRCDRWHHERFVLAGDAVHTAHFSIGSGTKLALEDVISLTEAIAKNPSVEQAIEAYTAERKPIVERTQRAAAVSLAWFENTERYLGLDPLQFTFSLLTRSLRVTHENLRVRDPKLIDRVDRWFSARAEQVAGAKSASPKNPARAVPPMFTPFRLRALGFDNRIVVSPMCQYSAANGTPNDWHLVHLGSRAIGGAGLVITEMTDVAADGRITPGCAGMYTDDHARAWRRIVDFVHANSAAKIAIQLAHAGRKGSTKPPWEGTDIPLEEGAWPIVAPSPIALHSYSPVPREMTSADLLRVRGEFAAAARRAEDAGFDMIELHFAHGYLVASFLSPLTNKRTDVYGGSLENRMRWPLEVFAAVREAWPSRKPVSVRISATDWAPGGFDVADAVVFAKALKAAGCDVIDVSSGGTIPHAKIEYGRLYQTSFAERIRLEAEIPTMTVGGITSYTDVNSILAAGRSDLCVLARAHLFDPYWTRHAAFEQEVESDWPTPYRVLNRFSPRLK